MAMPVTDLLAWDISVMDESLLKHSSYAEMERPTKLRNGKESGYGLGLSVGDVNGHRVVSHTGEVGGFVASNLVIADEKYAVAVLTNQEASPAASAISRAIGSVLLPASPEGSDDTPAAEALARRVLTDLQKGAIDRSLLTSNASFYFDQQGLADFASSLGPLGEIRSLHQTSTSLRGGMRYRGFAVEFANGTHVNLSTYFTNDGKIEQFLVAPAA